MQTGEPLLISDVTREPDYMPVPGLAIQSELVTPLFVRGRLVGVLNIEAQHAISLEAAQAIAQIADSLQKVLETDEQLH
jgi:putative methionine-R-sulfoxide reductase with GAF domain